MFRTTGEKVFNVFNVFILSLIGAVMLYPFINIIALSLSEGLGAVRGGITIIPRDFTLENYMVALQYPGIRMAAVISLFRTVIHTSFHLLIIILAAYSLSKKDLMFKKFIMTFFILSVYVNPGLIPTYLNYRLLHLAPNNLLLYLFLPSVFNLFNFAVIRTAIEGVPASLEESAYIDGAGFFKILTSIIVPLIMPTIAAIALFVSVTCWNEWQSAMYYFPKKTYWTLQYILQQVLQTNMANDIMSYDEYSVQMLVNPRKYTGSSIQSAILIVTTVPILFAYPFLQKYFTKGILIGAVKG